DILLLLLFLNEDENCENRNRARHLKFLRDDSNPFSLSENIFMKNFRLTREICRSLIDELAPHDNQKTSLPLTVRVLAALNFFGRGSYQKCVKRAFGVLKPCFRCLFKHRVLHYSHETSALFSSTCFAVTSYYTLRGVDTYADITRSTKFNYESCLFDRKER
ncbi:PREDICTED: uncharacterized protein LOC108978665, partial [Bactrocera latifrons]|uniref:uncharacterized protein LOC108978665 n=1 Tax=Bactrocera latifrons TaxID=174628 RepID=UPI0008DEA716